MCRLWLKKPPALQRPLRTGYNGPFYIGDNCKISTLRFSRVLCAWGIVSKIGRSNSKVSVGAVAYLNARPLIFALPQFLPEAEIVVDFPSRLAVGLAAGRFDVALIPSIEYLRQPGLRIASDAAIACDGPVLSVKLFSRVPVERVQTLALDEGSRTSAALAQILLAERHGLRPRLQPLPLDAAPTDSTADAMVVIGDRGMLAPQEDYSFVWDLGEEWCCWTGLPFVFALWAARSHVEQAPLDEALAAARDEGIKHFAEIARRAAPEVGLPEADCLRYLRDNLEFHLGPRQHEGLERFYELARKNLLG